MKKNVLDFLLKHRKRIIALILAVAGAFTACAQLSS